MRTRPDSIKTLVLASDTVQVDEAGYLTDPETWTPEFAVHAAAQEGIELSAQHQAIIDFMRAYLQDHGIAPDARFVLKFLATSHGIDKPTAKAKLFELFPYGYVRQACKIAGMRQPRAWSTG